MKKIAKLLVGVAAVVSLAAVVSRLTLIPILGIEARPMVGMAGLLLLFAIALQGLE